MAGSAWRGVLAAVASMAAFAGVSLAHASSEAFVDGPRVASGESPYGIPWSIHAGAMGGEYVFEFDIDPPGYDGVGWLASMPRSGGGSINFVATNGSDLSKFPEGDLSGLTTRKVRTVSASMSDGSTISFAPLKARPRALEKEPWLKRFRVFNVFFSDRIYAEVVEVFDRSGDLIERRESDRGSFFPK
jgi:hypothetical protein